MALTEITYTGDGSDVTFGPIPFPYLEDSDVLITINGVATTAFTIDPSTKIITFSSAPADGTVIRVYRNTNNDTLAATFISGSAIRAVDLNDNFTQNLYVIQEIDNNAVQTDGSTTMVGDFNMGGYKVTNLAAPVAGTDAATKTYVDDIAISGLPNVIPSANVVITQAGTGAVQRTVESKLQDVVSVKDFIPATIVTSTTDCSSYIQLAIDAVAAAGGGAIYFPAGTYAISAALNIYGNIKYLGAGCGASVLQILGTPGPVAMFRTTASISDVEFDSIGFVGSVNYPADSTVYKQTYANQNTAIQTAGGSVSGFVVKNCSFTEFSQGSIDINGAASTNIKIVNNTFTKGSYCSHVINIRHQAAQTEANRLTDIIISGNTFDECGPEYFYDPSKEDWVASANCIIVDRIKHGTISDNIAKDVAGGIRVEDSKYVAVTGNVVTGAGGEGISFYKYCTNCSATGNVIQNWGRIPPAYAIRNYSGTYVVAREFPDAVNAPLPVDPTASAWFDTWPYVLTNVNTASIIAYNSSDYYTGPSAGILPFRGYAAISYVTESHNISVSGNAVLGDTTQSGGKYLYACDFGVTPVHSVNNPTGSLPGQGCVITGNSISEALYKSHYHPAYEDPVNARNATGTAVYGLDKETSTDVAEHNFHVASGVRGITVNRVEFPSSPVYSSNPNHLDVYEEGLWNAQLTPASGSIAMTYYQCRYTRIGNLVHVTGEITVGSVSSPTGALTVNLPFVSAASSNGRNAITASTVSASGFTGSPTGTVELEILASSGTASLLLVDSSFTRADLSAYVQTGTGFKLGFSYLAS
jgi:hypothetical protein